MTNDDILIILDACVSRLRRTRDQISADEWPQTLSREELHSRVAQTARELTTLRLGLASSVVTAGGRTVGRPPVDHEAIARRAAKVVAYARERAARPNLAF